MRSQLRLVGAVLVATGLLQTIAFADGEPPAATPSPSPSPSTKPAASPRTSPAPKRDRPIATSIDHYVAQVLRSHENPCARAQRQGVPCFPVMTEMEGTRFSVAEALRRYRADGRPAPGPPTNADLQKQMSGAQQSASGVVSFDPGCTLKSLVRLVGGHGNTFYLYRIHDGAGEHPLLTDRKLEPNVFLAQPQVSFEFLGTFSGECEAVAAWRKALREGSPSPAAR